VSFYVLTATFFLLHCDKWDRVVALPRHKFVTGATLLQLVGPDRGSNRTGGEHANHYIIDAVNSKIQMLFEPIFF
jgi:hypothetical protein